MKIRNRKKQVSILVIMAVITIAGVFAFGNSDKFVLSSNNEKQIITQVHTSQEVDINTLDDLIKYSDNVIVGTVIEDESFSHNTNKYTVSIDKNLKGTVEEGDIDVYESIDALENGGQYILFLGYFDSPLYSRAVYTSMDKECIVGIDNEKLVGRKKFIDEEYSYKDVVKAIENSTGLKIKSGKKFDIKKRYESTQELIESSDCIVQIKVNESEKYNNLVSKVGVDIIKVYKGDIGESKEFSLPTRMETGKEYIVFFKNEDERFILSSRESSIISKDNTEEWDKTLDLLSNDITN